MVRCDFLEYVSKLLWEDRKNFRAHTFTQKMEINFWKCAAKIQIPCWFLFSFSKILWRSLRKYQTACFAKKNEIDFWRIHTDHSNPFLFEQIAYWIFVRTGRDLKWTEVDRSGGWRTADAFHWKARSHHKPPQPAFTPLPIPPQPTPSLLSAIARSECIFGQRDQMIAWVKNPLNLT